MKIGQVLRQRYTVVRTLKAGGMGAVFLAKDGNLADSLCAVKQMLDLGQVDEEYLRARFEAEMKALVELQHPGIPRVRDYFVEGSSAFLVMDYIDGPNLEEEREACDQGTMDPVRAVEAACQVLEVLDYMHAQDPPMVHRDIKPANLIREGKTGRIIVVDFGLARSSQAGAPQTSVGTLGFCAPEQVYGKAVPASDVYSLGATLFHLLSGQAPQITGIPELAKVIPGCDPELSRLIRRATDQDPARRFGSAQEMLVALRAWLRPDSSRPKPATQVRSSPPPRRGRAALLLLACLLLFIPLASYLAPRPGPKVKGARLPDPGLGGDIFSSRPDEELALVTLGEDIGLFWVGAAGGLGAQERGREIAARLNQLYHSQCPLCNQWLLEPEGVLIGKFGEETVLFYGHQDQGTFSKTIPLATLDSELVKKLGATSPKYAAGHWRNLIRDVVSLSRGTPSQQSRLGQEFQPLMLRLREFPQHQSLASNLRTLMGEMTQEQTHKVQTLFRKIPGDLKIKVDTFPKHRQYRPLSG